MREVFGWVLLILLLGIATLVLGAIIRFSIVSDIKTRGARRRLRHPDVEGLEALCGFTPPADLVEFYKDSPLVELEEFYLTDNSKTPSDRWFFGGFSPLTLKDVREWRKVAAVPGIPIADDLDKGVYFVARSGAVMLKSPNVAGGQATVATDIRELAHFVADKGAPSE